MGQIFIKIPPDQIFIKITWGLNNNHGPVGAKFEFNLAL